MLCINLTNTKGVSGVFPNVLSCECDNPNVSCSILPQLLLMLNRSLIYALILAFLFQLQSVACSGSPYPTCWVLLVEARRSVWSHDWTVKHCSYTITIKTLRHKSILSYSSFFKIEWGKWPRMSSSNFIFFTCNLVFVQTGEVLSLSKRGGDSPSILSWLSW